MRGDLIEQLQGLVVAIFGQPLLRRIDQPAPHLFGQFLGIGVIGLQRQQSLDLRRQVEQPFLVDRLAQFPIERRNLLAPRRDSRCSSSMSVVSERRRHLFENPARLRRNRMPRNARPARWNASSVTIRRRSRSAVNWRMSCAARTAYPARRGCLFCDDGGQQGDGVVEPAGRPHFGGRAEVVLDSLQLFGGGVSEIGAAAAAEVFAGGAHFAALEARFPQRGPALRTELSLRQVRRLALRAAQARLPRILDSFHRSSTFLTSVVGLRQTFDGQYFHDHLLLLVEKACQRPCSVW